ncbi:MAG: hypothetical protein ACHQ4H_12160, partial [Ktedonobacterales bacterium]
MTRQLHADSLATADAADAAASGTPARPSRTQQLQAERERYLPRGVFAYHPVYPASGSGARQ